MRYLGIDPGSACGWAVLDSDGSRVASGTWKLDNRRGDGAGMRYVRLERLVRELLEAYDGPLAYELVAAHKGTQAAHIYGGIVATITRVCEDVGRAYAGVGVGTIKKVATGKGNANKEAMMLAAQKRWPDYAGDDNEADSLWVAECLRTGEV